MLTAVGVAGAIGTDHVNEHEIKFASIFELLPDVLLNIVVKSVQIIDIETGPVFVAIEPLAELGSPNVVTIEDDTSIVALLVVDLLQDVVLHKLVGEHALRDLEHGVKDARKESLNAHDCGRWELRLQREQKRVLWILVHIVFEQRDLLCLVGVGGFTVEVELLIVGPLKEILSQRIKEHKDNFAARFLVILSQRADLSDLRTGHEEAVEDKLHRKQHHEGDAANFPNAMRKTAVCHLSNLI